MIIMTINLLRKIPKLFLILEGFIRNLILIMFFIAEIFFLKDFHINLNIFCEIYS